MNTRPHVVAHIGASLTAPSRLWLLSCHKEENCHVKKPGWVLSPPLPPDAGPGERGRRSHSVRSTSLWLPGTRPRKPAGPPARLFFLER